MKDKSIIFYENFVATLKQRIATDANIIDTIADLLNLDRKYVQRRLSGTVSFSFTEMCIIANSLGLSLDNIANNYSTLNRPAFIKIMDFLNPTEGDYLILQNYDHSIKRALSGDPNAEAGTVTNIIPAVFCVHYPAIYQYRIMKLSCQFGKTEDRKKYADVVISDRLRQINQEYYEILQNAPRSVLIFARGFIEFVVRDIIHFKIIKLLTEEDVALVKADLLKFLDDLERYANNGCYDTGKEVEIYLSNLHFDATYSYYNAKDYHLSLIRSFSSSDAYSFDEAIFENLKNMVAFYKRTATVISRSNMIERIRFFDEQRELVNSLYLINYV